MGGRRALTLLVVFTCLLAGPSLAAASPCEELIANGGFEGTSAWVIGATPRPVAYTVESRKLV